MKILMKDASKVYTMEVRAHRTRVDSLIHDCMDVSIETPD